MNGARGPDSARLRPWRWSLAPAALLALAGCGVGASPDPFADTRPPPGLAERFYPPENWAWGLIQVGDAPAQRYGVGAPAVTARADVLILPDDGESAETWFETARDLEAAGAVVWVLEGVGQGGSGRRGGEPRNLEADVAATNAMIDTVIRPQPRRPLILLGEGAGGVIAARAVEAGGRPAALVLSGGCGGAPPDGAWRRDGPDDFAARRTHDPWRGAVTHAWQVINPDLRQGGPGPQRRAALADLQVRAAGDAARIRMPTLALSAQGQGGCLAPPGAARQAIPGAGPALELEDDARRGPWLAAVRAVIAAAAARADPAASGQVP